MHGKVEEIPEAERVHFLLQYHDDYRNTLKLQTIPVKMNGRVEQTLVNGDVQYSYLSNNRRGTISFFGFLQPSTPVFAGGTFSFFSDLQPGTLI